MHKSQIVLNLPKIAMQANKIMPLHPNMLALQYFMIWARV